MVFSGLYPPDGSDFPELRDALDKLKLNDAACVRTGVPAASVRVSLRVPRPSTLKSCERLEREFNLDLISTAPTSSTG